MRAKNLFHLILGLACLGIFQPIPAKILAEGDTTKSPIIEIDTGPSPRKVVSATVQKEKEKEDKPKGDDPPPPPPPPRIVAPKEVSGIGTKAEPYLFTKSTRCILELTGVPIVGDSEKVFWDLEDAPIDTVIIADKYASFSLYESNLYQIVAYSPHVYAKAWFRIHSGTDPPDPEPGPNPPGPNPPPDPTKVGLLTVVIIKDDGNLNKLPSPQLLVLTSTSIRDYAAKRCLKNGTTPEFKLYDMKTDPTELKAQSPGIQKAFETAVTDQKKAGVTEPWIALSNGTTGYSGPLPKTQDETLTLLKKYGGE